MSTSTSPEIVRHYGELSKKETDAVVGIVADLIVSYLQRQRSGAVRAAGETHEQSEVRP